jgi:hypothetical protein
MFTHRLDTSHFPTNFCHSTETKTELIEKVFPNTAQNYKDHVWLSERVKLAAQNVDGNEMNFQIQNKIAGELMTYKLIDSVTNQDYVVFHMASYMLPIPVSQYR